MRSVFTSLSRFALLRSFVYILAGILMVLFPQIIMNFIVYVFAAYLALLGIINLISYFRFRSSGLGAFNLVSGVFLITLGILMVAFSTAIISILPIFLGLLLVLAGAFNLSQSLHYNRTMGSPNALLIVLNILIIVGGVLVIVNPFSSAVLLFQIFGGITLALGVGELFAFFFYRRAKKELPPDGPIEAEFTENSNEPPPEG